MRERWEIAIFFECFASVLMHAGISVLGGLAIGLASGCVTVSPAMPVGDNAYLISVVSHNQWKEAIESGVTQANEFCAGKGAKATITNTSTVGTDFMSSS